MRSASAWWTIDAEGVATRLAVDPSRGLDDAEVEARRSRSGWNRLPEARRTTLLAVFARQFKSPLIYLLFVAAAIALALDELVDVGVILGVLLVNAVIGTIQEGRAEHAMEGLRRLARPRVRVRRGGRERELDAEELVPGDLLVLAAGDAIGADARVVESAGLEASESVLTGESEPVHKRVEALDADTELAERRNLVFAGTHVAAGHGCALVVATGVASEFGRIALLTSAAPRVTTPLERRMAQFGRVLLVVALLVCASVVMAGHLRGLPAAEVWMVAISQLVSVVPEGLPVALTVGLAVGMQRMAARRAIVRQLAAVETLGSTSVICSDKTGTLTRNELTVAALYLPDGREIEVTGVGYAPAGEFLEDGRVIDVASNAALLALLEAAALCNDA
ncbi:MAG: HAD-IC family P-type ATPase, partial [Planctomycetes bacterium]|nr:HAD-IC family P-type ATPase [Planctomycetota bacterium]